MKKILLAVILGVMLGFTDLYAADGDFIIEGNVGIGTDTPAAKLEVSESGTIRGASFNLTNVRRGAQAINTHTDDTQPFGIALDVSAVKSGGIGRVTGTSADINLTHSSAQSGVQGGTAASYTFQVGSDTGSGSVDIDEVTGFRYSLNRRHNIPSSLTYNVADSYGSYYKVHDGGTSSGGKVNVTNHFSNYIADYSNTNGGRMVDVSNFYGLYIENLKGGSTNNYGLVLAGDGSGSDIAFGPSQQVKLFRDSSSGSLKSNTSIQITDSGTKPSCDVNHRGEFWTEFGDTGVKDTVEVCSKDANDAYAWRQLY